MKLILSGNGKVTRKIIDMVVSTNDHKSWDADEPIEIMGVLGSPRTQQVCYRINTPEPFSREMVIPMYTGENQSEGLKAAQRAGAIGIDYSTTEASPELVQKMTSNGLDVVIGTSQSAQGESYIRGIIPQTKQNVVLGANMGTAPVIAQEIFKFLAREFPGVLQNYLHNLEESHQETKKKPSATMSATLADISELVGKELTPTDIRMIRKPAEQLARGIPAEFLKGHGYHWNTFSGPHRGEQLEINYKVNGRDTYAQGSIRAAQFLIKKRAEGIRGEVYSMADVLRNK
jgi:4-hydroxy-tetrahydrodipicolinate reductase